MSWVKLDDGFTQHPKVLRLSDASFRWHVDGMCYSAKYLTDGFVPRAFATHAPRKVIEELEVDLWAACDEGWWIHDWLDYHQPAEQTKADRQKLHDVRAKAGLAGARSRWDGKNHSNGHGKSDGKELAAVIAPREATA